ncbi:cytochrome c oxidase, subunit II [Thiohalorhabdus denitrificans]|uniref:Cytochrome c oxidase subunit 2 n=1 Tax=Thiohalorhabdus denitrificans TaxID=381306 RepID=A0A1G5EG31_9GAMM|nr:cytochrome c oxidase, subunit II [Thiohalorhabdus denitrificans]
MFKIRGMGRLGTLLAGALPLLAPGSASAGWDALNMPAGVTPLSGEVYNLHMLILWICVAIGIVVFGTMIYSIIRFRKRNGAEAAQFHESTTVEIIWTIIPFLILVGMAIPATGTLIDMEDASGSDITVKVTGYQWNWHYEYMGEGVDFYSNLATPVAEIQNQAAKSEDYLLEVDNRLVVPTDTKIHFLITAEDVLHSWWVPDLGMKKDAIPGFVNEMWARIDEPGVYRGQCTELCGRGHAFMPVVVEAKPPEEYRQWLEEQKQESAQAEAGSPEQVAQTEN